MNDDSKNIAKKVILDCDPGMDDSMAIVMAAKSRKLELLAVTTVNGNYSIETTSKNALKTLEMIARSDIPIARGMGKPMIRPVPKDPFTHGIDGQAENFLPEPASGVSKLHAVDLIIQTVKRYPGEVYILCTGPMTNLALALIKAPEIVRLIPAVIAISGMFGLNEYAFKNATGDTPQSEWNVYVDPEAADIVYRSGVKLVALGLDVATHFDVNFTEAQLNMLKESNRKEARFLYNAIQFVTGRGFDAYCTIIDCLAIGYAIDPTFVKTMKARVGIETKGVLSLGMTVVDRRHHHVWNQLPEIEIGMEVDYTRFLRLLIELVLQ